ncbi:hypothetical protein A0J57_04200 [Sphingobium sp. 22B]|uniref:LLM class flavin-dependent oxidoreductase n=1 Tax=unclassified Sphingobium TaxID=2611147 RepID=UPI0007809187|nr:MULTISPECIES: LLM class flavin-dependent oxidoreductase [unclassified Sphingobium]KXU33847.1 hypothetical protein AXW74_00750 [Sphingobium sp. AM]KYC33791.1 hypothetical protein A0J57_04200 [Sphingobium sp. 22B]OAP33526.1 hypothetical protein A8O16_03420 [Sphingobium sp. 20006FA]
MAKQEDKPAAHLELRFDMRRPDWTHIPKKALYDASLSMCAWAEDNGFESVTLAEHHLTSDHYMCSPAVMAGAVAARTERLAIRMIILAPFYNPLRLVEDLRQLAVISGGRTLPVISGGYREVEFAAYGARREDRLNIIDEVIDLARKAEAGGPFRYRGRSIDNLSPAPEEPLRMLMAASFPRVARRAAQNGADGVSPNIDALFDVYREELRKLGKPDPGPFPVTAARFVHVVSDVDQGWEEVGPHLLHWVNSYKSFTKEIGGGAILSFDNSDDIDALRRNNDYMIVTPSQLAEHMNAMEQDTVYQFWPLMAGLDPALGWKSLRLLQEQVIPNVRVRQNFRPLY